MSRILIMTSTIAPAPDTFLLAHKDPQKRLNEYKQALSFYLGLLRDNAVDTLIYADNSGHDLLDLRVIAQQAGLAERCEFISFHTPAQPDVSRYFLEINLLKTVMERSEVGPKDEVWKVTGRYIILNAANIIRQAPRNADLYVNCRNHPNRTVDFYLVRFNRRAFADLLSSDLQDFQNPRSGEDELRVRLDGAESGKFLVVPRFSEPPQVTGTRGFDGAPYDDLKGQFKFHVRRWLNRLFPQLWI